MDVLQPILVIDKANRLDQLGEVLSDSGSVDDAEYKTGTKVSRPPTHSFDLSKEDAEELFESMYLYNVSHLNLLYNRCLYDLEQMNLPSAKSSQGCFTAFIELRTLACFLSNNMSILNSSKIRRPGLYPESLESAPAWQRDDFIKVMRLNADQGFDKRDWRKNFRPLFTTTFCIVDQLPYTPLIWSTHQMSNSDPNESAGIVRDERFLDEEA